MKAATYFRGGMQMGSVCGAITGSLMALGLAGVDDPQAANDLIRCVRDHHDGMINCKGLLRSNAEKGGEKMPHCNAMIRECIGYVDFSFLHTVIDSIQIRTLTFKLINLWPY